MAQDLGDPLYLEYIQKIVQTPKIYEQNFWS